MENFILFVYDVFKDIMAVKGRVSSVLSYLPRAVKSEFKKNRNSTPFLVSVSFTITFLAARLWVVLLGATRSPSDDTFYVGRNLIISGYHIHHIAYGIILISVAAWLSINYWSRNIARISSICFGAGLGFIVDEMGFIIEGIEPYRADREVFYLAAFLLGVFLSIVYFPSFYRSIKRDIRRFKRLLFG